MSTNSSYVLILSTVIRDLSLTINFLTLTIGVIGILANLITFTAPKLRRKSCTFYLLCSNIFQLLSVCFCVPTRMALDQFNDNLERQSVIYCKIRYYLVFTLPTLAAYYLLLSTLDRCLATYNDVNIRAWSRLKVAHRLSIFVFILVFLTNIHILVYYTIYNNNCQTVPDSIYTVFFAGYLLSVGVLFPYVTMLILCLLTLINMKRTKRRVAVISNVQRPSLARRFEIQILMAVILQVVVSGVFSLLRTGSYTHFLLTSGNNNKTTEERATESFALQLGVCFYYFSFGISFYVSTLTSKYFRDILWKQITRYYRYCRGVI